MRSLLLAYSLSYAAFQTAHAWSLNFGQNDQQLLNGGKHEGGAHKSEGFVEPISSWQELDTANYPAELKASLKDIAKQFPNGRPDMSFFQPSKRPTSRKPVKSGDKQAPNYVATSDELPDYALRGKKVDLKELGVDNVTQYAGYFDVVPDDRHLFYWFFESRNDPKNDPVILWLNGGPGCSSLTGLFFELGPSAVKSDGKNLKFNPYSWNSNASVIFLDQPVNTGFSYSTESGVYNSFDAAIDVYAFLQLFFQQFPQYTSQDFHIAGESYAGHYIPVFATEILKHDERNFNLSSVLIGNGLTDGYTQYAYYEPMACGKGGYEAVLDEEECENMLSAYPRCAGMIKSCYETGSSFTCLPATIYCNNAFIGPYQNTGRNVYDIRGQCESGTTLCYKGLDYIDSFLNIEKVKKALGVEVEQYEGCNFDVNRKFVFAGDWMKPIQEYVPPLLESGIPVLIYAGDKDFICNWLGNQGWTNALEWSGAKQFRKAPVKPWLVDGEEAGTVQSYGNFTFLRVYEAGHMVPFDQPENALSLVNTWIWGKDYA